VESLTSKRRIPKKTKKENKKKGEQELKSKRGETSYKEDPYFKKKKRG
jgi:hypothetical protein